MCEFLGGGKPKPLDISLQKKWCHRHGVPDRVMLWGQNGMMQWTCMQCDAIEQAMLLLMDSVNAGGDAVLLSHAVWHLYRVNEDAESVHRWAAGIERRAEAVA